MCVCELPLFSFDTLYRLPLLFTQRFLLLLSTPWLAGARASWLQVADVSRFHLPGRDERQDENNW